MNMITFPRASSTSRSTALRRLFELAAVFRAGDQGPEIEGDHALVLEALWNVALDNPQREPLGNRRLAHAGLADQHGVVFVRRERTWITRRIS